MPINYMSFEYIFIDAAGNLRSKAKFIFDNEIKLFEEFKESDPKRYGLSSWFYDGSSTLQAIGTSSDIIIKPQFVCKDPFRCKIGNCSAFLVMCDTYDKSGVVHKTNNRFECEKISNLFENHEFLFGMEQEYMLYDAKTDIPYGWIDENTPRKDLTMIGPYYCSIGGNNVECIARQIMEEHISYCMYSGLHIRGVNCEVNKSQLEFQIGEISSVQIGDELYLARYILDRICEKYGTYVNLHPKPLKNKDFNGSGGHTNISTNKTRSKDGMKFLIEICEKIGKNHSSDILSYGNIETNKLRLTGNNETSSIEKFSYGISDRGSSLRIPLGVVIAGSGYIEDRRIPADFCPYKVCTSLINTICS